MLECPTIPPRVLSLIFFLCNENKYKRKAQRIQTIGEIKNGKRLFPRMYYSGSRLFGLSNMQAVASKEKIIHNGGWYNNDCEKLGWGDLGVNHFEMIENQLVDREKFIILQEKESYRDFTKISDTNPSFMNVSADEQKPGVQYILENAFMIIVPGKTYRVDPSFFGDEKIDEWRGKIVFKISRDICKKIILA